LNLVRPEYKPRALLTAAQPVRDFINKNYLERRPITATFAATGIYPNKRHTMFIKFVAGKNSTSSRLQSDAQVESLNSQDLDFMKHKAQIILL
jgi:hypothetical protein